MTSASSQAARKGPWLHQFLVYLFTGVFTLLSYWLLGFIIDDIGNWPEPQYGELEKRMLDQSLVEQSLALQGQAAGIDHGIREQKKRQGILRDSASNSRGTMNQLLEFRRPALQKSVMPTAEVLQVLDLPTICQRSNKSVNSLQRN